MFDEFIKFWPVVLFLGASTVWFVRLESKVLYLEKDHENHKQDYKILWAKIDILQTNINEMRESLARIEERLK